MIKHYDLTESSVMAKPYEAEALYYCTDSKNIYFDSPTEGERIKMSSDTIILGTEAERAAILAPIADKVYIVLNSSCMYIYRNGKWILLGGAGFQIPNILISGGNIVINDSRITSMCSAEFVVDLSVADLVEECNITCTDGSATIIVSPSTYDIFGTLLINGGGII